MPGLLIEISNHKYGDLLKLAHSQKYFKSREIIFNNAYLGLVDFERKIGERALCMPRKGLGIVIYGDIYLDRENLSRNETIDGNIGLTLLNLYKKYGIEFIQRTSGSFVLAIHDSQLNKTFVAVDYLGSKPMYIYCNKSDEELILSSEVKAIKAKGFNLEYNREAVREFLTFSFLLSNKTLFNDISLLPPSSVLIYDHHKKEHKIKLYNSYKINDLSIEKIYDEDQSFALFDGLFKNSIQQRIKNYGNIGLFLSDGLDSRLLSGYCKEICDASDKCLVLYTFGSPGGVEEKISREIAAVLGIEHHFFEISGSQIASFANEIVINGDGHLRIRDAHFVSVFKKLGLTHDIYLAAYFADTIFGQHIDMKRRNMESKEELLDFIL